MLGTVTNISDVSNAFIGTPGRICTCVNEFRRLAANLLDPREHIQNVRKKRLATNRKNKQAYALKFLLDISTRIFAVVFFHFPKKMEACVGIAPTFTVLQTVA